LARIFLCLIFISLPGAGVRASTLANITQVTTSSQTMIDAAQDGDTIIISSGTYTESLTINKNLTLVGQADMSAIVRAVTNQRVITVQSGHNLTLKDLVLSLGSGVNEGGGVRIENGNLTIDHCNLYGNQADYGGAIFQGGTGQVIVQNQSYIYNNHSNIDGGGIYTNGNLSISDSWMESDSAGRHGGAATVVAGNLTVSNGAISYNQAGENGGAFNVNNSISVNKVVFISNSAGTNGGAILQWNGDDGYSVIIQQATFELNKAGLTGGALSVFHGTTTTISQSTFTNNEVDTKSATNPKGGAVYFSDTDWGHDITIDYSTFNSNSLKCSTCPYPSGGGLYAVAKALGEIKLDGDTFISNNGWIGGGVAADSVSKVSINRSIFQGNIAGDGAGAYLTGISQITKSSFYQNSTTNGGGGLVVSITSPSLVMEDTKFIGNKGGYDLGGAMNVNAENITLKNIAVADTQVLHGSAILFSNPESTINLYHITVNDTHLQDGSRTGTFGIHLQGPMYVNIWNSMITNHGTGVQINSGSMCTFDHTLWFGNAIHIDGLGSAIESSPIYGDPAYSVDRYHLTSVSGAIDQGVDFSIFTDIDGDTRDDLPDIGADEYRVHVFLPLLIR
jgi:predicted outer membrane repeat protein